MAPKKSSKLECPVANALDVIGDYWSMMILRDLMIFGGTRRFDVLCDALDISRNILTERLRNLVAREIVRKVPVSEGARRMEYKLTRKGWALVPVLLSMGQWCSLWEEETDESDSYKFVDSRKGEQVVVPGVQSVDGKPLGPADIRMIALTPEAENYLRTYR